MVTGHDLHAMRAFGHIAKGRTFGYVSDAQPEWQTALTDLQTYGKDH